MNHYIQRKAKIKRVALALGLILTGCCYGDDYQQSYDYPHHHHSLQYRPSESSNKSDPTIPNAANQKLRQQLREKLGDGMLSQGYPDVVAEVNDGAVILKGSVRTWEDKERLEKEIRNLDGVKSLESHLGVQIPSSREPRQFPQDSAGTASDDQLNKKIRDRVSKGWFWDSYQDIRLNTVNGVVTLEGIVDRTRDQQNLISEIQKIEGVKSVINHLSLKNSQGRDQTVESSDRDGREPVIPNAANQKLRQQVREKLGPGWISEGYPGVDADVKDGLVTLGGSVPTWEDKEKIEREIRNIHGVKALESHLVVQIPSSREPRQFSQDTYTTPADEQLNKKIRDRLNRGCVREGCMHDRYGDIALHTSNGVVRLEGRGVDTRDQQNLITEIQKVEGVKGLKNNLYSDSPKRSDSPNQNQPRR